MVVYLVNHLLYILSKLSKQNLSISEQKRDIVIFYVNKRIHSIEKFMNGLLIHPLIKNSQILFDFLSIQNEEDFNKKKEKYENLTSPTTLGEIKSLEGDIKMSVSKEKEMYLKNIQDNCYLNMELLQKIKKAYKELMLIMSQSYEKMK